MYFQSTLITKGIVYSEKRWHNIAPTKVLYSQPSITLLCKRKSFIVPDKSLSISFCCHFIHLLVKEKNLISSSGSLISVLCKQKPII